MKKEKSLIKSMYLRGKVFLRVYRADDSSITVECEGEGRGDSMPKFQQVKAILQQYGLYEECCNKYGGVGEFIINGGTLSTRIKTAKRPIMYGIKVGSFDYMDTEGKLEFSVKFTPSKITLINHIRKPISLISCDMVGDLKYFLNSLHRELWRTFLEPYGLYWLLASCSKVVVNRDSWQVDFYCLDNTILCHKSTNEWITLPLVGESDNDE